MPKLTKKVVDALQPGPKDVWAWDTVVRGFGLRVRPSGTKTFALKYSLGSRGRSRRVTIGGLGSPWTTESARAEAQRLQGAIKSGADPAAARAAARGLPTVAALGTRYLLEHAVPFKSAASAEADRRMLKRVIGPSPLGRLRVDKVTTADVKALHHARRETPTDANRALALLSKLFSLAEAWGLRPRGSNPVRGVQRFEEKGRARFLSEAELARLGAALREAGKDAPSVVAAVRLLLFTGARRSEILNARWEDFDREAGLLRIERPKEGTPKVLRLGSPALAVLRGLRRIAGNPFIVPGVKAGRGFTGLSKAWERIRARAGLEDVRLHDLRHSWASVAAAGGASLPVIGALLGHVRSETTRRYAHLGPDPLRVTADAVQARIEASLKAKPRKAGGSTRRP